MKTYLSVMLAGVAAMAVAPAAYAASEDFCNAYAEQAVAQNNENATNQCGFTGARWHDNFQIHQTWCLSVNEDLANSETQERTTALNQCTGGSEELGDEGFGGEELGDEALGDEELGDEELGDEELGDEELGDEDALDDEYLGDEDEPEDDGESEEDAEPDA